MEDTRGISGVVGVDVKESDPIAELKELFIEKKLRCEEFEKGSALSDVQYSCV